MAVFEDSLQSLNIFQKLSAASLRALAAASSKVHFDAGQLLFSEGDVADFAYLVTTGEIAIETFSINGQLTRVATLRHGELIGELGVLGNIARTADARAITNSELIRIHGPTMKRIVRDDARFTENVIKILIGRINASNAQIENMATQPLKARVAKLVNELAASGGAARSIHITQSEMAKQLSATREKVNVHLQSIQRSGAIKLARGRIDVVDLPKLEQFLIEF